MKYILLNLCIIIIICILIFYRLSKNNKQTNELIKEQGWILYLLENCPHSTTQLQDLVSFKEYIIYNKEGKIVLNLVKDSEILPFTKIKSFPLWYNTITKEKKYGVQDLKSIVSDLV